MVSTKYPEKGSIRIFFFLKLAILASIVGVLFTTHLMIAHTMATHPGDGDFPTFYLTSVRIRYAEKAYWSPSDNKAGRQGCAAITRHLTPDQVTTESGSVLAKMTPCLHANLNPPFMIAMAIPLAYLDYATAWWASWLVSLLCIFLIGRTLVSLGVLTSPSKGESIILWMGYFVYFPTLLALILGQVTFLIFLPVVLGWHRLRRGHEGSAGAWLGMAAAMKPFIGLFFVGLVALKSWRAFATMGIASLVCSLLGGLVLGFEVYPAYLALLGKIDWQTAHWNASFAGFFSRLFGQMQSSAWLDEPKLAKIATLISVMTVLGSYFYSIRLSLVGLRDYRSDAMFGLTIPAMLLVSPLGWIYYFPMLLLPLLFLWRRNSISHRGIKILILVFFAMTTVPSHMTSTDEMMEPQRWLGVSVIYLGGLLGIFALTVCEIYRERVRVSHLQDRAGLP